MQHPIPTLEYNFEAAVGVAPRVSLGQVHGGERRVIPTTGGVVSGPLLTGRVVPGGTVDPALIHFRTTPVFEVRDRPHGWLARHIFVATGQRHPKGVLIRFVVVR